ncbi:MAG: ATP--guanido phosphotransferase [Clostridia bacterium]
MLNQSEYVISTRVRIARNIKGFKFPNNMNKEETEKVNKLVKSNISNDFNFLRLKDMDENTILTLVEKHLISYDLAKNNNSAIVINKDSSIVIMVNEEDHIRLQAFGDGLDIDNVYNNAKKEEYALNLDYANDSRYGYLTSCLTNIGSGLRISVMVHLPGLVKLKKLNKIVENILEAGVLIRGLYGENTAGYGDMFQLSNKSSFGESDDTLISNLKSVISYVISQEKKARELLLKQNIMFEDNIFKSYGTLKYARYLSYEEAMENLSKIRVGISLGLIDNIKLEDINELMKNISGSSLKINTKLQLNDYEENIQRAEYIRKKVK